MSSNDQKSQVFGLLRPILSALAQELSVAKDTDDNYYLNTLKTTKSGSPVFFGAVQIKKQAVSFHLMPVYSEPALLESISPDLRKRMQGKSCFNFKAVDEILFQELEVLTKAAYQYYVQEGLV